MPCLSAQDNLSTAIASVVACWAFQLQPCMAVLAPCTSEHQLLPCLSAQDNLSTAIASVDFTVNMVFLSDVVLNFRTAYPGGGVR